MSLVEVQTGQPLISEALLARANFDSRLANRMLFLETIGLELLLDPNNANLQEIKDLAEQDMAYFKVLLEQGK